MTLVNLFILLTIAILIRVFPVKNIRKWLLLIASIVLIFWLQPALPVRYLDFYLPTLLVGIILLSWLLLSSREERAKRDNYITVGVIFSAVFAINLTRFINLTGVVTPSRPPGLAFIGMAVVLLTLLRLLLGKTDWKDKTVWVIGFVALLLLMLVLKNPDLRLLVSKGVRSLQGQNPAYATRIDIQWLGFSYVVFRLMHTIKDFQNKRLKEVGLLSYVNYIIFFPAFTAGPIDRIQHFENEFRITENLTIDEFGESLWRLVVGVFKKFAIADTLAIIALNISVLNQTESTSFVWLSLYAYAFLIYFDFSGYTDIAIGLGYLLGIKLPENFNAPYLKPNLKLFWDNWHMTLTQWFRAYYFNPISRKIRRKWRKLPVGWMVLIMQVSTMLLIGLWHGVTWNFVIWGLWHGLGMFVFNRWNEWYSPRKEKIRVPFIRKLIPVLGVLLTFHFVALGWVWFALPNVGDSLTVFSRLFGG